MFLASIFLDWTFRIKLFLPKDTKGRSWETFGTKRRQSFRCVLTPFRLCCTGCFRLFSTSQVVYPVHLAATWSHGMSMNPALLFPWKMSNFLDLRQEMATSKWWRCSWSTAWTKTCYPPKGGHLWTWHVQRTSVDPHFRQVCFVLCHWSPHLDILGTTFFERQRCEYLSKFVLVHDFWEVRIDTFLSGGSLLWQWGWIWVNLVCFRG